MKPIKYQIYSDFAYQWLGKCVDELYKLNQSRKQGSTLKKQFEFPDGVLAEIIVTDFVDIIRMGGGSSFISHPRTTLHPNGVDDSGKDLNTTSLFPLIDDDNGSALIDLDGASDWTDDNYGNIPFVSDIDIISWRGPSGGYILNDPAIEIPGFTTRYEEYDLYTPLSPNLYQEGGIRDLGTLEGNIRCAAIIDSILWVVIENRGSDELRMQKDDKWVLVASRPTELYLGTAIPCIFQSDKVILQKGEWTFKGEWSEYIKKPGTLSRRDGWDITKTVSDIILQPGVNATFDSTDKTTVDDSWSTTPGTVQAYALDNGPVVVSGPDAPIDGDQYTATGGTPPYTWTISDGSISSAGYISGISALCGAGTVTATDQCDVSGSKAVQWPTGGSWQATTNSPGLSNPWNYVGDAWYYAFPFRVKQYTYDELASCGDVQCYPTPHPDCPGNPPVECPPYNTWQYTSGEYFQIFAWQYDFDYTDYSSTCECILRHVGSIYRRYVYQVEEWKC